MTLNVPVCSFYLLQKEPQKILKSFAFTALLKDFNGKLIWLVFSQFYCKFNTIVTWRRRSAQIWFAFCSVSPLHTLTFTCSLQMQTKNSTLTLFMCVVLQFWVFFPGRAIKQVQVESKSGRSFCSIMWWFYIDWSCGRKSSRGNSSI